MDVHPLTAIVSVALDPQPYYSIDTINITETTYNLYIPTIDYRYFTIDETMWGPLDS